MADDTTVHHIIEKMEVKGFDEVDRAFEELTRDVVEFKRQLDPATKGFAQIEKAFMDPTLAANMSRGMKGSQFHTAPQGWEKKFNRDVLADLKRQEDDDIRAKKRKLAVAAAVGFIAYKTHQLTVQAFEMNTVFERAEKRIQGLVQGLSDFGNMRPMEKAKLAGAMAVELMKDYKAVAFETATPLEQIEAAAARINPILSGLGKTQQDVTRYTKLSAAAAAVYGERAEEVGKIVAKAIGTGTVEGEGAFAMAFKSMAQLDSKMTIDKRMEKARQVLVQMGAPVAEVTKGTAAALARWKVLSDDVLVKVTKPAYDAIGARIAKIVDYTNLHGEKVDAVATKTDKLVRIYSSLEGAVVSAFRATSALEEKLSGAIFGKGDITGAFLSGLGNSLDLIGKGIDWIGSGVNGLVTGSFDRWWALTAAIQVKTREVALDVVNVVRSLSQLAPARFIDKTLGLGVGDKFDRVEQSLKDSIAERTEELRGLEEQAGMGGSTDATAKMIELEKSKAAKAAREAIERQKGIRVVQQIGTLNVIQDLRGENSDTVMVEFQRDLEKLGERAYQSAAGGAATVFGPGGNG